MKRSEHISFRLVAYTDAAGRYSPDAFRNGNEDNFYVNCDLTGKTAGPSPEDIIRLGDYGMVMAVADGMGGANAGEVASQIAVDTLSEAFKMGMLSEAIVKTSESRQKYMEQIIKETDGKIKVAAGKNKEMEGMGSTMIIAWLFGNELSISWCGDSRAYIFNERTGIRLVSMDHSYVQELVNKGVLSYEQTFDHPQNNIITRSLGDPSKAAKPESRTVEVGKGDIILLNSDGLSGVLRDRKTYDSAGHLYPEDNLEDIIRANTDSMEKCREALWLAAEEGGWYDNVTAILCQITEGPEVVWAAQTPAKGGAAAGNGKKRFPVWLVVACAVFVILVFLLGLFLGGKIGFKRPDTNVEPLDSAIVASPTEKEVTDGIVQDTNEAEETIVKGNAEKKPSPAPKVEEQAETKEDSTADRLTLIPPKADPTPPKGGLTPIVPKSDDNSSAEETTADDGATTEKTDSLTTIQK